MYLFIFIQKQQKKNLFEMCCIQESGERSFFIHLRNKFYVDVHMKNISSYVAFNDFTCMCGRPFVHMVGLAFVCVHVCFYLKNSHLSYGTKHTFGFA